MPTTKPKIKIDWATHKAALLACKSWHYARSIPAGKTVKVGVWEDDKFIGAVIFSRGANPNVMSPFGLKQTDGCELTRVALKRTHQTPVSQILAKSIKFLRKQSPDLKLIVSYADIDQNHHGGIYQATNWIYIGKVYAGLMGAFIVHGQKMHPRTIGARGGTQSLEWVRKNIDPNATKFITQGKHKYLFALDRKTRRQIEPLRKPYPKRKESATCNS